MSSSKGHVTTSPTVQVAVRVRGRTSPLSSTVLLSGPSIAGRVALPSPLPSYLVIHPDVHALSLPLSLHPPAGHSGSNSTSTNTTHINAATMEGQERRTFTFDAVFPSQFHDDNPLMISSTKDSNDACCLSSHPSSSSSSSSVSSSSQTAVWKRVGIEAVETLLAGMNATLMAYGQTGTGKTYTMGSAPPPLAQLPMDTSLALEPSSLLSTDIISQTPTDSSLGLIPRVLRMLFEHLPSNSPSTTGLQSATQSSKNYPRHHSSHEQTNQTCTVKISFMEIYQEQLRDLLDPEPVRDPVIREDKDGHIVLSGITECIVNSVEEALALLQAGITQRTTGETRIHEHSSRSHAIFSILLERRKQIPRSVSKHHRQRGDNSGNTYQIITSKLHCVDLAGSERVKKTGAEGIRFKESIKINSGLLALGNVISILGGGSAVPSDQSAGSADRTTPRTPSNAAVTAHVPYRDSKLTRLLQDSLGGNSKTWLIACISPDVEDYEETLNTLKYADRARRIQNRPVVNQVTVAVPTLPSSVIPPSPIRAAAELSEPIDDEPSSPIKGVAANALSTMPTSLSLKTLHESSRPDSGVSENGSIITTASSATVGLDAGLMSMGSFDLDQDDKLSLFIDALKSRAQSASHAQKQVQALTIERESHLLEIRSLQSTLSEQTLHHSNSMQQLEGDLSQSTKKSHSLEEKLTFVLEQFHHFLFKGSLSEEKQMAISTLFQAQGLHGDGEGGNETTSLKFPDPSCATREVEVITTTASSMTDLVSLFEAGTMTTTPPLIPHPSPIAVDKEIERLSSTVLAQENIITRIERELDHKEAQLAYMEEYMGKEIDERMAAIQRLSNRMLEFPAPRLAVSKEGDVKQQEHVESLNGMPAVDSEEVVAGASTPTEVLEQMQVDQEAILEKVTQSLQASNQALFNRLELPDLPVELAILPDEVDDDVDTEAAASIEEHESRQNRTSPSSIISKTSTEQEMSMAVVLPLPTENADRLIRPLPIRAGLSSTHLNNGTPSSPIEPPPDRDYVTAYHAAIKAKVDAQRETERKVRDLAHARQEALERTTKLERQLAATSRDAQKWQSEVQERDAVHRRAREEWERKSRALEKQLTQARKQVRELERSSRSVVVLEGRVTELQGDVERLTAAKQQQRAHHEAGPTASGSEMRKLKDMNRQMQEELKRLKGSGGASPVLKRSISGSSLDAKSQHGPGSPRFMSPVPPTSEGLSSSSMPSLTALACAEISAAQETLDDSQDVTFHPELTQQLANVDSLRDQLKSRPSLDLSQFAKFHQASKSLRQARSRLDALNRQYLSAIETLEQIPIEDHMDQIQEINTLRQDKEILAKEIEVLCREKREAEVLLDQGLAHSSDVGVDPEKSESPKSKLNARARRSASRQGTSNGSLVPSLISSSPHNQGPDRVDGACSPIRALPIHIPSSESLALEAELTAIKTALSKERMLSHALNAKLFHLTQEATALRESQVVQAQELNAKNATLAEVERDLFYYRKRNKELKEKLRQLVAIAQQRGVVKSISVAEGVNSVGVNSDMASHERKAVSMFPPIHTGMNLTADSMRS